MDSAIWKGLSGYGSRDLSAVKTHMCTFRGIALRVAGGAKGSRSASGLVWVVGRRQRLGGFDERPGTEQCHCSVGQATQTEKRAQETCFHAKVQ